MSDKRPKRHRDANQLAKSIVDLTTGDAEEEKPADEVKATESGWSNNK